MHYHGTTTTQMGLGVILTSMASIWPLYWSSSFSHELIALFCYDLNIMKYDVIYTTPNSHQQLLLNSDFTTYLMSKFASTTKGIIYKCNSAT